MQEGAFAEGASDAVPIVGWSLNRQPAFDGATDAEHKNCASYAIRSASGLPVQFVNGEPVVHLRTNVLSLAVKRGLDLLLSVMALLFLAPLLLAVAVAIRATSPGPALFRQDREGQNGKRIAILKFRSMYLDRCDASGLVQAKSGDSRVTRIGRFLRKTSLDELPQLINIAKGDMSVVGPRPHVPGMLASGMPYETLVPYYSARLAMKPGLSGWAQVNGYRGPTDNAEAARARIDHDLAYIANFSLWLDIKIIALTLVREMSGGSGD